MADGIDDGGLHRGRTADGAAFADALGAQRVEVRGRLHVDDFEAGQLGGRDERVVGQVGRDRVAVLVVADFLEQGLRSTLSDATVDLAFEQHRVQHAASVVACDLAQQRDLARLRIDFHYRHVRAEREAGRTLEEQRVLQTLGQIGLGVRSDGQVGPALRDGRRTRHVERAVVLVEHDVGFVGLQQFGGQLAGLLDQFDRGVPHRGAAMLQRA